MEKRRIGSLDVSVAGLGCNNFGWRIGPDESKATLFAALDAGVNFLDTADVYGAGKSEEYLGNALGDRRKEVVLATKFGMEMAGQSGGSPTYVRQAADASLRRLKTDWIDLYQIHKPDPKTPIADTLGGLNELVRAGKVREIGCSNFSSEQLREANDAAGAMGLARFVSVQNEYSLFHREPEENVLSECQRLGIAFIPYFPLASGLLTGKYRKGRPLPEASRGKDQWGPKVFTDENLEAVERFARFAETRHHTLLELAFSWLLAHDVVASVIAGAKTPQQATANAGAANWRLTAEELSEIDRIFPDGEV
ncbi:MAG TPA: aldo/keto reductase [Bryobacteraceae bacterium]|nr:aldo/keto reductase [Bryobacteraceae bacterium]